MSHTHKPPRELDEIDVEYVNRKAPVAVISFGVTDRIVQMIGGLSQ